MKQPKSVKSLENFGRVRLSKSFFMRDFLHSEIANFHGLQNIPADPDLAIEVGMQLCENLLEPLNSSFGRVAVRSGYRSPSVNELGNRMGYACGSNQRNYARHIWDRKDKENFKGAMACIVLPPLIDQFEICGNWEATAKWICTNLPYSELEFYPKLMAFNIGWHEQPKKTIRSYIRQKNAGNKNHAANACMPHGCALV